MTKRELFINFLKDSMRARTLHEILAKELREAYLSKLNAETAQEYAQSIVSNDVTDQWGVARDHGRGYAGPVYFYHGAGWVLHRGPCSVVRVA